jgi:hypothetical protein
MASSAYTWDATAGRFRGPGGRYVAQSAIDGLLHQMVTQSAADMNALTKQLAAGSVTLQEWQAAMRDEIKSSQLAAAALAKGGWEQMTPADFGRVGQSVRISYQHLQTFAQQLATGSIPLDGRVPRRAELYPLSARSMYDKQQRAGMVARGMTHERNVLSGSEHCDGCVAETDRGWVPIGELVPVGSRDCLSRCRCSVDYEAQGAQEEAA